MSLTSRMDILDLVIQCLQEHEKELDNLTDRLEKAAAMIEKIPLR